jgi:hypothetical protein
MNEQIKKETQSIGGEVEEKLCGNAGSNVYLTYKGGCRKPLAMKDAYRCGGCGGWFHKECLYKHFELEKEHDYGRVKALEEFVAWVNDRMHIEKGHSHLDEWLKLFKKEHKVSIQNLQSRNAVIDGIIQEIRYWQENDKEFDEGMVNTEYFIGKLLALKTNEERKVTQ